MYNQNDLNTEEKSMQNIRKITDDMYYIGCSDRRLALFESAYPIKDGISYNSYLINDDKTVLLDTVDKSCAAQFLENLDAALNGRILNYIVIHHMEPDHCAVLSQVVEKFPEAQIICSSKTVTMINQFFDFSTDSNVIVVKEGDTISSGKHEFNFIMAPMVHWPEVMVTYDKSTKTLFSADAFGSFGAINGNLYDTEVNWERDYLDEARRYYANIAGKYGTQVQMLLKKAANLDIKMICPLHSLIIKDNINLFIKKYSEWSAYTPEVNSVLIAYSSVYGGTENAVNILASKLSESGIKEIKVYDVSHTHPSFVLADAFKYSHIIIATTTYNNGIFETMETFIHTILAHNLQNRKFVVIQNGSWAPACGASIKSLIEQLKNCTIIDDAVCIKSSLKNEQLVNLEETANKILKSLKVS